MENKENQINSADIEKIKSNLYYLYSRGMITKSDLERLCESRRKGKPNEAEKE